MDDQFLVQLNPSSGSFADDCAQLQGQEKDRVCGLQLNLSTIRLHVRKLKQASDRHGAEATGFRAHPDYHTHPVDEQTHIFVDVAEIPLPQKDDQVPGHLPCKFEIHEACFLSRTAQSHHVHPVWVTMLTRLAGQIKLSRVCYAQKMTVIGLACTAHQPQLCLPYALCSRTLARSAR